MASPPSRGSSYAGQKRMKPVPANAGSSVERLVHRLDEAVSTEDIPRICEQVKQVLSEEIAGGQVRLSSGLLMPSKKDYARRLLHRDPEGRYTVVVMIWAPGQSTPIHDHGGRWCVECVYQGTIRVTSYALVGGTDAERIRFRLESEIMAGIGEAGALIPPYDYHVIRNMDDPTAITIHVYGGEMIGCHAFYPLDGGVYRREWCELRYTT